MAEHHGFDLNVAGTDQPEPRPGYFAPWAIDTIKQGAPGEYITDRLGEEAEKLSLERGWQFPYLIEEDRATSRCLQPCWRRYPVTSLSIRFACCSSAARPSRARWRDGGLKGAE